MSNWAYMVIGSLAWSRRLDPFGAGIASAPDGAQGGETKVVEDGVRDVLRGFIEMPCQIVRGGRRLIYRLLSWNPWQDVFLRLAERLHGCWLC